MRTLLTCSLLPALLLLAGCAPGSDRNAALYTLVRAEQSFAQASVADGIRPAFLHYLADDAVLFRPTPVNGKAWYTERTDVPGLLDWQPAFADVSGAGDLGYTTGPWTYSATDTTPPAAYGHYVSVWKKQPDGAWRVALDAGIAHPPPENRPVVLASPDAPPAAKALRAVYVEAARITLLRADRDLAAASEARGSVAAFLDATDDSVRVYRDGAFPVTGKAALQALLAQETGVLTWAPIAAEVAGSGDLGYTYGLATLRNAADTTANASSSYLRLWRREGEGAWRVVLDLAAPIPSED